MYKKWEEEIERNRYIYIDVLGKQKGVLREEKCALGSEDDNYIWDKIWML